MGYIGAPYNFIPFDRKDRVVEYDESKIPGHDETGEELLSGEIEYSMQAKTPVFVGSGIVDDAKKAERFYQDVYGRYAIPGSSVRGLVRSNVQILSLSSIADDIDDYNLMYRKVGGKAEDALKGRYEDILGARQISVGKARISVLKEVKAGYIQRRIENGKESFVIYGTTMDKSPIRIGGNAATMNYFVLSERTIAEDYEKGGKNYEYIIKNTSLQHNVKEGFFSVNKGNRIHYYGYEPGKNRGYRDYLNPAYKPFAERCSFTTKERSVTSVGAPDAPGKRNGFIVGTGSMSEKKALYLIPDMDKDSDFTVIPDKDIQAYRIDFNKKETILKGAKAQDWFDLPKDDQPRPVFYIKLGSRVYFGYTPHLRIFYDHSIKDGLSQAQKETPMDYAKALFGYSKDNRSRKSRVSFSDAVLQKGSTASGPSLAILAEPKPTSYLDYVEPEKSGEGKNYNDEDFKLRGTKQYWLKKNTVDVVQGKNDNVASRFIPLEQGAEFTGKIRFHNLKEEELGLLVWGIYLSSQSEQNIGKAKPYGFGRVQVDVKNIRCFNAQKAYSLTDLSLNPLDPWENKNPDEYILTFKEKLRDYLNLKSIDLVEKLLPIKSLLLMKENIPEAEKTRYMSIDKKEYQSRTTPLPNAEEVSAKKEERKAKEDEGETAFGAMFKNMHFDFTE